MAASSHNSPLPSARRRPTAERLLDAAEQIFARDGLTGATTREIARAAGVNEVTLFRHFQTKENLVSAVAQRMCGAVADEAPSDAKPLGEEHMKWIHGLEGVARILAQYAKIYYGLLMEYLPIIRTFIGEIHRHHCQEEPVIKSIFRPQREKFMDQLKEAQTTGIIRKDVNLALAADQLCGMIFTNVLKQRIFTPREYSVEAYLEACAKMVAQNIEATPAEAASRDSAKPARTLSRANGK